MLAIIEAVAMPPEERGRKVQLFAYTRESKDGRGGRLQDANVALEIVKELTIPDADGESPIIEGLPPRGDACQPLWEIIITVENTHKSISRQTADYRKFDGCPVCASEAMMDIYAEVRRTLRKGLKGYREMKAAKKAKARAA